MLHNSGSRRLHPLRCQSLPTPFQLVKLTHLHSQDSDTHAIRPGVFFSLPDSRPGPCKRLNICLKVSSGIHLRTSLRHMTNIESICGREPHLVGSLMVG